MRAVVKLILAVALVSLLAGAGYCLYVQFLAIPLEDLGSAERSRCALARKQAFSLILERASHNPVGVTEKIQDALLHPDFVRQRGDLVLLLGMLDSQQSVSAICSLAGQDDEIDLSIAQALGMLKSESGVPCLSELLNHDSSAVVGASITSLSKIHPKRVQLILLNIVSNSSGRNQQRAVELLNTTCGTDFPYPPDPPRLLPTSDVEQFEDWKHQCAVTIAAINNWWQSNAGGFPNQLNRGE